MELKEERLKELYEIADKTAKSPAPKRSLLATKCPKCGNKLDKESVKGLVFAGEGCTDFAKKMAAAADVPPGVYNLTINHFKCNCGYEYAKTDVSTVSE